MKKLLRLATLGGLALRAAGLTDLPGEPLVYKRVDGRELRLFVFNPADWRATDRRPALVFFHGGAWTGGEPSQLAPQSTYPRLTDSLCLDCLNKWIPSRNPPAPDRPRPCLF